MENNTALYIVFNTFSLPSYLVPQIRQMYSIVTMSYISSQERKMKNPLTFLSLLGDNMLETGRIRESQKFYLTVVFIEEKNKWEKKI